MATVRCEAGVLLFDTSQMGDELKQAMGIDIPEKTLKKVEQTLPPKLQAATATFCERVCQQTGTLDCQAKIAGPKLVSSIIAGDVLFEQLDKILIEPDPGDNGHLAAPSPYVQ